MNVVVKDFDVLTNRFPGNCSRNYLAVGVGDVGVTAVNELRTGIFHVEDKSVYEFTEERISQIVTCGSSVWEAMSGIRIGKYGVLFVIGDLSELESKDWLVFFVDEAKAQGCVVFFSVLCDFKSISDNNSRLGVVKFRSLLFLGDRCDELLMPVFNMIGINCRVDYYLNTDFADIENFGKDCKVARYGQWSFGKSGDFTATFDNALCELQNSVNSFATIEIVLLRIISATDNLDGICDMISEVLERRLDENVCFTFGGECRGEEQNDSIVDLMVICKLTK